MLKLVSYLEIALMLCYTMCMYVTNVLTNRLFRAWDAVACKLRCTSYMPNLAELTMVILGLKCC